MIWILFIVINKSGSCIGLFSIGYLQLLQFDLISCKFELVSYFCFCISKWICKGFLVRWEVSCGRWILVWQHLGGFLTRCVWNFAKAMILWWRRALFQSDELSVTLERRGSIVQWVPCSHCTQSTVDKKCIRCFELRQKHCALCTLYKLRIVHIVQIALKSSNSPSKSICEEVTTLTDKTAKDKALTLVRCELNSLRDIHSVTQRILTCIMLVPRWILHQGEWKHWLARDRVMNRWSGCQVSTPSLWIESHLPCTKALFHVQTLM